MLNIKYKISYAINANDIQTITADPGANLLELLREHQAAPTAACNGKGICGKCRVRITQGHMPVTEEDRCFFTEQELAEGYRLACKCSIRDHITVLASDENTKIQALGIEKLKQPQTVQQSQKNETGYAIAVDLGSTTLAAALIDMQGNVLDQAVAVNSQRAYGADVLSRMQASNEGKREQLQACICRDLEQLFLKLVCGQGAPIQILNIAIAGNTTMFHLLRGYSCEMLGQAPFEPVSLKMECLEYRQLFAKVQGCSACKVYLLPGMSAFIGADVTAGLYSSGFWQTGRQHPSFFIDLGTNGELAYGTKEGFVTASTAAGPAFEGGRLSCGTPGIPGAISKVTYLYHRVRIQTIGQKKPCGICGTGAMEAAAALRTEGLMDTEGLLAPQIFDTGMELARREDGSRICLTQADIREIQMAKAAIRAGLFVLQKRYEQEYANKWKEQEGHIYLAGGFGYYLSADAAITIGLFEPEWKEKIVLCANTSLKGAIAFLTEPSCARQLEQICSKNRTIRLESDADFQEMYVRQMRFPAL